MEKIDFRKEKKEIYNASAKEPLLIVVPEMNYIKVDGIGSPQEEEFQSAAKTLYPVAYTLKFMCQEVLGINYGVMPMEVIWTLNREKKGEFKWTMMLMQPEFIRSELYKKAYEKVKMKFNPPLLDRIRFESVNEGLSVQMLHKGPYEQMNNTLDKMLGFIENNSLKSGRDTHDIYLNDSRKTKPENLKTIMRLPVSR